MAYVLPRERIGRVVAGRYRLVEVLGEGGTSVVYEADDARTSIRVALKLLKPELAVSDEARRRFAREARFAAACAHPAAARVSDAGTDDDEPWLVAELVKGPTLSQHLRERGALDVVEALDLMIPLVDAVGAAHRQNVVHRDLKPSNVVLAALSPGRRYPKLLDFGLARVEEGPHSTTTGTLVGTPHYMAPEQAAGEASTKPEVDVWALGVMLFECLEGKRPFDGPSATAVLMNVLRFAPPPLTRVDPASPIAKVVARALEKDPDARYRDADALRSALEDTRHGLLDAPTTSPRVTRPARLAGMLFAGALLGAGGAWVARPSTATTSASRAPAPAPVVQPAREVVVADVAPATIEAPAVTVDEPPAPTAAQTLARRPARGARQVLARTAPESAPRERAPEASPAPTPRNVSASGPAIIPNW